jgi:hypothetical protein
VFPNASCLGIDFHDSQRPRGVIYRLAVTSPRLEKQFP